MKRVFLGVLLLYAVRGRALPVNIVQADSLVQQVAEGNYPGEPPAALAYAARATFLLLFMNEAGEAVIGSATVVAREVDGRSQTLDLLTAEHVISRDCDEVRCANLRIYANGHITRNGKSWRAKTASLVSPNVRVLARSPRDDLALLRISTDVALDVTPITLAEAEPAPGERVYKLGYTQTWVRADSRDPEPQVLRRRWSQGEVMGVKNYRQLAGEYLATTADALIGDSGGPLVDAHGELVGLTGLTGAVSTTGFRYLDSPSGANHGVQAAAIRLKRVRGFLDWVHGSGA